MLSKISQFVHPIKQFRLWRNSRSAGFDWVKNHFSDIILLTIVILISLLSFACGFLFAKYQEKEPIRIEYNTNL